MELTFKVRVFNPEGIEPESGKKKTPGILPAVFSDINALDDYLNSLPANVCDNPYPVIWTNNSLTRMKNVFQDNFKKYVSLDLSTSAITIIDDETFDECSSLVNINIPEGVQSIGISAFYDCSGLEGINIPDGVKSIGSNAFKDCYNLASATIGKDVKSIGLYAFQYCCNLANITLGSSVESIGGYAFYGCYNLAGVTFKGTIVLSNFSATSGFPGDLRDKFYAADPANGKPGTYITTRTGDGYDYPIWTYVSTENGE